MNKLFRKKSRAKGYEEMGGEILRLVGNWHESEKTKWEIHHSLVDLYYEIGGVLGRFHRIRQRWAVGREWLIEISKILKDKLGKGFSVRNLEQMYQFWKTYQKRRRLRFLTWSHFVTLLPLSPLPRFYFETLASTYRWSVRRLKQEINKHP